MGEGFPDECTAEAKAGKMKEDSMQGNGEDFNATEAGPLPLLISGLPNLYFQHRARC